jgi:hypothetical protein
VAGTSGLAFLFFFLLQIFKAKDKPYRGIRPSCAGQYSPLGGVFVVHTINRPTALFVCLFGGSHCLALIGGSASELTPCTTLGKPQTAWREGAAIQIGQQVGITIF